MINVVDKETLEILPLHELRGRFRNLSIPTNPKPTQLAALGYALLSHRDPPAGDKVVMLGVAELDDGSYYPTFQVDAYSAEELSKYKQQAVLEVNDRYENRVRAQLSAVYPTFEQQTWLDQREEATAWSQDNAAPTPCIDSIMAANGKTDKAAVVSSILQKAQNYQNLASHYTGLSQAARDSILAAGTKSEVDTIVANV